MPEEPADVEIPYLRDEEFRQRADAFLRQTHPTKTIPVPIERMVERLGIDIVPIPGLQRSYDLVGAISIDRTRIFVDQWVAESRENRYRFTLAHEIGHLILHPQVFDHMRSSVSDIEAWYEFPQALSEVTYRSLEFQANTFAGLVLVPLAHLAEQYEANVEGVKLLLDESERRGFPKTQALELAWDTLAERIALAFLVSKDVILKRLGSDGYSPAHL